MCTSERLCVCVCVCDGVRYDFGHCCCCCKWTKKKAQKCTESALSDSANAFGKLNDDKWWCDVLVGQILTHMPHPNLYNRINFLFYLYDMCVRLHSLAAFHSVSLASRISHPIYDCLLPTNILYRLPSRFGVYNFCQKGKIHSINWIVFNSIHIH